MPALRRKSGGCTASWRRWRTLSGSLRPTTRGSGCWPISSPTIRRCSWRASVARRSAAGLPTVSSVLERHSLGHPGRSRCPDPSRQPAGLFIPPGRRQPVGPSRPPLGHAVHHADDRVALQRVQLMRMHPMLHIARPHEGIDVSAPMGAPIEAPADGTVIATGWETGYGNTLEIDHGFGIVTRYAHTSRILVHGARGSTAASVWRWSATPASRPARTCTTKCTSTASRSIRCATCCPTRSSTGRGET